MPLTKIGENMIEPVFVQKINDAIRKTEFIVVSVKAFGAKGDGITDDTQAFNDAITHLANNRTDPPNRTGWGVGTLHVPKGKYLINGTVNLTSAIGLKIYGDGAHATTLIRTNNTGVMFNLSVYIYVSFQDMYITHSTISARSTWSNICFNLIGIGGGREFSLIRVETQGFKQVINNIDNQNGDTNFASQCTFQDCVEFLYARNSQGVVNNFEQCTWSGSIDKVFNMWGWGHTYIDTANIVVSGTVFSVEGDVGNPTAWFTCTNVKFEFWEQPGGTSVIVKTLDNPSLIFFLKMTNCGISGGSPDPNTYQFDIASGKIILDIDGGQWGGCKIRTKAQTTFIGIDMSYIKFKNCYPPNTTITRVDGDPGSGHPVVIFENCDDIPNIVLTKDGAANVDLHNKNFASGVSGYGTSYVLAAPVGLTATVSIPHYGQTALVEKIAVLAKARFLTEGCKLKAYKDAAKTQQIGTDVIIAEGTTSIPEYYEIAVPSGTFVTEGVFVVLSSVGVYSEIEGRVYVETISV